MTAELSSINPSTSLRGVVLSLPHPVCDANVLDGIHSGNWYTGGTCTHCGAVAACPGPNSGCAANCDVHPACMFKASGLPVKPIKALPDPLAMLETLRESERRWAANDYMNYDRPDATALIDEIERLQVAESDCDQLLETTTGVLLVLSRLWLEGALTAEEMVAVTKFRSAEKEARNG